MKKLFYFLTLIVVTLGCTGSHHGEFSRWIIEKTSGERDTIIAKDYWIISADTQFIKFQLSDGPIKVYNKENIISFQYETL